MKMKTFDKILGCICVLISTIMALLCAYWCIKNNSALPVPLVVVSIVGVVVFYREMIRNQQR